MRGDLGTRRHLEIQFGLSGSLYLRLSPLLISFETSLRGKWENSFKHVLREGNQCAVWLAKFGVSTPHSLFLWDTFLISVSASLLVDAVGIFFA